MQQSQKYNKKIGSCSQIFRIIKLADKIHISSPNFGILSGYKEAWTVYKSNDVS